MQQVVWGAPLLFGWAHLHHFFERRRSMGWQQALLSVLVQFAYTYLFGSEDITVNTFVTYILIFGSLCLGFPLTSSFLFD